MLVVIIPVDTIALMNVVFVRPVVDSVDCLSSSFTVDKIALIDVICVRPVVGSV